MLARITISSIIEKPDLISKKTKDILCIASDASRNPSVTINSGWRSPTRQAYAMYENLSKGNFIRYAAAGREVLKVYNQNVKKSKEEVIDLMIKKINELSAQGIRVSSHCVSEDEYRKMNIVDVSKYLQNPRDFCKELIKNEDVVKIITPYSSDYNSKKISVDAGEPAIHVEIKQ